MTVATYDYEVIPVGHIDTYFLCRYGYSTTTTYRLAKYKMIRHDYEDEEYSCYADITTDGELILILLFRLAYRVDKLSPIVSVLQSPSLHLSVSVQNDEDDDDTINNNDNTLHVDDGYGYSATTIDGELILVFQPAYRIDNMYRVHKDDDTFNVMQLVILYHDDDYTIAIDDQYEYSTTTIDGELILLFRLAYRVDRMYRVNTVLPPAVLLLQSRLILLFRMAYRLERMYHAIAVMQLVALYQGIFDNEDDSAAGIDTDTYNDDIERIDHCVTTTNGELLFRLAYRVDRRYRVYTVLSSAVLVLLRSQSVLILLFQSAYQVNGMYRAGKILLSSIVLLLLLQPGSVNNDEHDTNAVMQLVVLYQDGRNKDGTIAIMQLVVLNQDRNHSIDDSRKNGETKPVDNIFPFDDGDYCNDMREKRLIVKYQLRALRSEGQYKDEVYNANEGMFQEPITSRWLDYYLVIISFSRTSIGDGGETTTLISTTQNGKNKKIEEKEEGSKEPVPRFLMIQMCLCFCSSIVTLNRVHNVLGQSMGSVKIHKDRVNRSSQTRARLESTFGIQSRTLESCIQSDVFVCSSLLKLVCSFLLKENTTVKNCLMRRCTYGTLIL